MTDRAGVHHGRAIEAALLRLGHGHKAVASTRAGKVNLARVSRLVEAATGRPLAKQRLAKILAAARPRPQTVAWLAEGLGVGPQELVGMTLDEYRRRGDDA